MRTKGKGARRSTYFILDEKRPLADLRLGFGDGAPDIRLGDLETRPWWPSPRRPARTRSSPPSKYDRCAPVIDSHGAMLGIATADDVLDVAGQATESIQKLGGLGARAPYGDLHSGDVAQRVRGWRSSSWAEC